MQNKALFQLYSIRRVSQKFIRYRIICFSIKHAFAIQLAKSEMNHLMKNPKSQITRFLSQDHVLWKNRYVCTLYIFEEHVEFNTVERALFCIWRNWWNVPPLVTPEPVSIELKKITSSTQALSDKTFLLRPIRVVLELQMRSNSFKSFFLSHIRICDVGA